MPRNRFFRSILFNTIHLSKGKIFGCVMAVPVGALLIVAAKTVSDYNDASVKDALVDVKAELYFAEHPPLFCTFEGVWYDWERDETITLGCLQVNGNNRAGNYRSATGPRATSTFSMSGTYDVDTDSCIRVIGKDRDGKIVKFSKPISVEDVEYPTQMIFVDENGEKGFFIWKRKE
jgi:hypothetical protein